MADAAQKPGTVRAWWALGVLCLLYVFAVVDRHVLAILVQPLQEDLGIGDFGLSLLMGPAFVIFYAVCGLPMGWAIDRFSRRFIVFGGMVLWSLATCAAGFAGNFQQLFATRIAVGVGESGLTPAAHSILADTFPRHRLSTAVSAYTAAAYAGVALGTFGVGALVSAYYANPWDLTFPIVGELRIWQFVFLVAGLPGIFVAFLALTLPGRTKSLSAPKTQTDAKLVNHLKAHPRAFLTTLGAAACNNMMVCAIIAWLPMAFVRTYDWSLHDAALATSLLVIAGGIGQILAGPLIDRLESRGMRDAPLRALLVMLVIVIATGVLGPLAPQGWMFVAAMLVCNVCLYPALGYMAAATQTITPSALRGRASALYMLCISMIGAGLGPVWIGWLTEKVFADQSRLNEALSVFVAVCAPLTFALAWLGLKSFRTTRDAVEASAA